MTFAPWEHAVGPGSDWSAPEVHGEVEQPLSLVMRTRADADESRARTTDDFSHDAHHDGGARRRVQGVDSERRAKARRAEAMDFPAIERVLRARGRVLHTPNPHTHTTHTTAAKPTAAAAAATAAAAAAAIYSHSPVRHARPAVWEPRRAALVCS